ncbi:carboxypeptidase-like regulatory domain-containing protein [Dactylosporangium salmoneum]|uniref:carboxypeptidase-like regulatory domain-containing protein n=1 Tax=Dactylosporangium salmoneum TaxID=53361 RepID=UPI0031E20F69
MAVTCTVRVQDVNGRPVAGAQVVVLGGPSGAADAAGRWSAALTPPPAIPQVVVTHPAYVQERVAFAGDLRTEPWDNALVQRAVAGDDVTLTVTLGRLDTCPVVELNAEQIKAVMQQPGRDPHAALLWRPPKYPNVRAYTGHWNDQLDCYVAEADLLPEKPVAAEARGWAQFHHHLEPVRVDALGRFYWLRYPAPQADGMHTVAVFSPNLGSPDPLSQLDFVLFYSPNTSSYSAAYPYGLVNDASPFQQYFDLGKKYLLDEFYFVAQLLARKKRVVTVMPIVHGTDWGPLTTGEGALRLLREVAAFLHRQCRTSAAGVRPPGDNPDELCGPNLRTLARAVFRPGFGPVPPVGGVAVAGFSTGIDPVKQVMRAFPVAQGTALWGVPSLDGTDALRVWNTAFRELWDLDGFHPDTGGWPGYLKLLRPWFTADGTRILRSYHSSGRVPPDPDTDPDPVWKDLRGAGLTLDRRQTPPGRWARIKQNERWTSVRMSDSYVDYGPGSDRPVFLDAHHTTPRIGFSHAAGLTKLG